MIVFLYCRRVALFPILVLLLAGCATKTPSFGDLVLQESGQIGAIGTKWEEGTALLNKGRKQLKKGEQQLEDGRLNISQGERKIIQGQRLVDEATQEYKVRQGQILPTN